MHQKGISAYGSYIPALRMSRTAIAQSHSWALPALKNLAKGTRAFCSWDEDAITLGVESLRNCLKALGNPSQASALHFASTTAPFDDYQHATHIAAAAGLPTDIQTTDTGGSQRAGMSALLNALNSTNPLTNYVVAADCRLTKPGSTQELQYGAGAATLAIADENLIARFIGSYSQASQFADHYRAHGEKYDYYWEERWIRDEGYMKLVPNAATKLLSRLDIDASEINYFCMPGFLSGLAAGLARKIGLNAEAVVDNFAATIGDTGTPQPLLMLIAALERAKPGEKILVVGFGTGCDVLLFETTDAIADFKPINPLTSANEHVFVSEHYNQFLSFGGLIELDWGMRAEVDNKVAVSQLNRAQDQVTGFNAGQCSSCGAIQFPILSTCVKCGSTAAMSRVRLADQSAKVATYSSDRLQYYPAPPMYWGLVQFDNGARLLMEMINVNPSHFDVNTPLEMTYRIKQKDERRHFHRYFWKAMPLKTQNSVKQS